MRDLKYDRGFGSEIFGSWNMVWGELEDRSECTFYTSHRYRLSGWKLTAGERESNPNEIV